MKISNGGGVDDECIEIIRVNIEDLKTLIFDETKAKTPGLMFALSYFLEKNKRD